MSLTAGIDVGASTTKVIILDKGEEIRAKFLVRTGGDLAKASEEAYREALAQSGLERNEVSYIVSTGFGRYLVPFRDIQVTDITSHARGILHYFPHTRSALDIGAQSTRAFKIEPNGRVKAFRLNDKCAAGAGAFLVRVSHYLEVPLEEMGPLSLKYEEPQTISSVCAVLAETEIINHISAGAKLEDILKGAMTAIADQSIVLLRRVGAEQEVALSGGVSKNVGVVQSLEERLGQKINYSSNGDDGSLFAGAMGAAILGQIRLKKINRG